MTDKELLTRLRAGERARWLPKSVIYDTVRGEECRFFYLGRHQLSLMEDACNGKRVYRDGGGPGPRLASLQAAIREQAELCGCTGVIFSGDPRGATVKVTFPDAHHNDFNGEGYCVPVREYA